MSDWLPWTEAVSTVALLGQRTESRIENLHVGLGTGHGGAGLGVADLGLKKLLLQLREFVGGGRGAWQS